MISETPRELFEKGLITEEQFRKIDSIHSGAIFSVFYELRTLLYLGVILFTTGAGVLIYQNIGELGHLLSIITLSVITAVCFWYVITRGRPYSNLQVEPPNAYYDYVLLLGALLFVSIQGYIQFQYETFTELLEWNTLITAVFFFFLAYRFDHLGILSLAVTAFASFWGLRVSTQKWYSFNFLEEGHLHITAIVFASLLALAAMFLERRAIKQHFTFTYLFFCCLIFFSGALGGLFIGNQYNIVYALIIYAGCALAWMQAQRSKSFVFLIFVFVSGYIVTTYLLFEYLFSDSPLAVFYYFLISCGGIVYLIIRYRNFFKRA